MAHPFKTAVFDLDGTLLDTSAGILSSVKDTARKLGLPPLPEGILLRFIGPPIRDSFARHYALEGAALTEAERLFRNRYKSEDLFKAVPYDGIYDTLEALLHAGITPAVATYKRQDYAIPLLRHFGFHRYTGILCGSDPEGRLQKADIIKNALDRAGSCAPAEAVMVGDTDNDAAGAARAGMAFIGVTYGFGFRTEQEVFRFRAAGAASSPRALAGLIIGGENET